MFLIVSLWTCEYRTEKGGVTAGEKKTRNTSTDVAKTDLGLGFPVVRQDPP